MGRYINIF
jgi:hypothetical protein